MRSERGGFAGNRGHPYENRGRGGFRGRGGGDRGRVLVLISCLLKNMLNDTK